LIDGSNGALQPLVTAVGPNIFNGDNFTQYVTRYSGKFQGEGFLTISTLTYDAMISVALGMAAIPQNTPITGTEIAANLPKIADKANGTVVQAQGSFISEAISALAQGGTIDLSGVSGELDYDGNGDVRSDYLRFIAVDNGGTWELDANAVYLYGTPPGTEGFWRLRCGAAYPANDCTVQNPGPQSCIAAVGLCLEVGCADNSNPCDDGTCIPQGPGFCAP
jgi:branched-chain amino acid transport system substrate-binding protein